MNPTRKITAVLLVLITVFNVYTQENQNQPNILIFIADDAGMDFGCYGNSAIKTPNIDKLSATGLQFNTAFLTTAQCSPSRTSILSGQFAHSIGTEDLHVGLNEKVQLLPSYLKQKGYFTGMLMKQHLGKNGNMQFDHVKDGDDSSAPALFKEFLEKAKGKPFFSWVAFHDPHRPYGGSKGAENVHNPDEVTVSPYFKDSEKTRQDIAQYYDEIHRMDHNIGLMLKELEKQGFRKNTIVIFLSDNGMPFPRHKATSYDSGIHTPLIMQWEGNIPAGVAYNGLVSVIDLAPTLLDIVGIEKPSPMYGHSIKQVFSDQSLEGRQYIFSERNWHDTDEHMRSVRSEKYKLIVNGYPELLFPITGDYSTSGTWRDLLKAKRKDNLNEYQAAIFEFPRYQVELYDLENDPYEINNLIDREEYQEVASQMNMALLKWKKETRDYPSFRKRRSDVIDRKSGFFFNFGSQRDYKNFGYWDE